MSYDVNIPNSTAAFDIVNMTGPNSTGDPTFPVSTTVNLSSLSPTVPEPSSWILMAAGAALLALAVRRRSYARLKAALSESSLVRLALLVSCVALLSSSSWAMDGGVTVKLNVATAPSKGVAGISFVNATGSGFPATAIVPGNIKVSLAPSCGGAASATTSASTITTIVDPIKRVNFQIPGTLAVGTYYV